MAINVRVRINNRNKEKTIKKVLKSRKNRIIENIELEEDGSLIITFSDSKKRVKNIVKQYSKSKYDRNSAIRSFFKKKSSFCIYVKWNIIKIIELEDEWIIFFMRN